MSVQRLRVWFAKGERVRYISHLDTLRYWERCIRRAGLPLSYSQGFTPHPKLQFAGPLPMGFLAEEEVVDVSLDERVAASEFETRLRCQATDDLRVVRVEEVALSSAPPQAALRWADYRVEAPGAGAKEARLAAEAFLTLQELPWTEQRHDRARTYDLRATVARLAVEETSEGVVLHMRLQADPELMARPEQVLAAILPGVEAARVTRTGLYFEESSPARELWRRRGRFE